MIYNVTTFTKNKIFEAKFSPDINKLGCKPSREKKKDFFCLYHQTSLRKRSCKHDQFNDLAIDTLFGSLCRSLHDSFGAKL